VEAFTGWIDALNRRVARAVAWLVPLLVLGLVYDTLARYLFNAPTSWAYDLSTMLYGAIFTLAAAHTLQIERHVRIETLYARLSVRKRALIDAIGYLVFFFPVTTALLGYGGAFALRSWQMLERSGDSMWQPPIYPFKTLLPLAALLLLLQGLAQFIRCLQTLRHGHPEA
jgi:TRAP-type mannitol/chloroaromatic compound transport system permease small subunit